MIMLSMFLLVALIFTTLFIIKPTDSEKSYSQISKEHDQISINLTKVFDFIG